MQQIKYVVDERVAVLRLQGLLQLREAGNAALVLDYDFAVDERGLRRQPANRGGDVRELVGPVEALAGEQADLAMIETRLDTVAVELDFVNPSRPGRRLGAQRGERRRHEIRKPRRAGPRVGLAAAFAAAVAGATMRGRGAARTAFAAGPGGRVAAGGGGLHVVLDAPVRMPHPLPALALCDVLDRAAAHDRQRHLLQDVAVVRTAGRLVGRLDQEPIRLLLARAAAHAHEMPAAVEFPALEDEVEAAFLEALVRVAFRRPGAA